MPPRKPGTCVHALLAALVLTSCSSGGTAGPGASQTMHISAGNSQTASPNTPVAIAPAVTISDQDGKPLSGIAVTFAIASGGGHFNSVTGSTETATAVTGANGVATAPAWTLGIADGVNSATASAMGVSGSPATFTATAATPSIPQISIYSGNNLAGPAGVQLDVVQFVKVTDAGGIPIQGASVTYVVTGGGGMLEDDPIHTTGPTGLTFVRGWVLGTNPGINTMTATITGTSSSVTFTATGH
jgi:adhesin/invasin